MKLRLLIISILLVATAILIAVVLGLVFGLKKAYSKDCDINKLSDTQKFESCKDLACKNSTVIYELNNVCPVSISTTSTIPIATSYRLPKSLQPNFYDITIKSTFDSSTEPADTFDGNVLIEFKCIETTNLIILHQKKIDIDRSSIKLMVGSTQINIDSTLYNSETELYTISLPENLEIGQDYTLTMSYKGKIGSENFGVFKSYYLDSQYRKRWLLTTQLETTYARQMFPCFDEPDLKAKFKLTVIHNKDMKVLNNMPIVASTPFETNHVKTEFGVTTVKMSTYLVAFVISDFECISNSIQISSSNNVDVRVCGRPDAILTGQFDYALNISTKVIKHYSEIYGVDYPLPKCDHVAIPAFDVEAMENWGLITYGEKHLLVDSKLTSQSDKKYAAELIAHELAHMWFGNLVTTKWWNTIWLNEGFATYVQYVGVSNADESLSIFEEFVDECFGVLSDDSYRSSRSVSLDENEVYKVNDIFGVFDTIAYQKGGCLIKMMNYIMTEKTFIKGIRNYLKNNGYQSVVPENLWIELEKAAQEDSKLQNLNISDIMNTWTKQIGHPVVTVEMVDSNNIKISQKQFLSDPSAPPSQVSSYDYKWYIPFSYSVEKVGLSNIANTNLNMDNLFDKIEWLKQNEDSKIIRLRAPLDSDDGFILGNLDVSGFYRVNYDDTFWKRIIKQLNNRKDAIPTRSRAQLINDAFDLSFAGLIPVSRPFELIGYLSKETEYLPWLTALNQLSRYTALLESKNASPNFYNYLINLITPMYNQLGWNDRSSDSWLQKRLRTNILSMACDLDTPSCVSKAKLWYSQWMRDGENTIPANYRSFIYCTAIRNGGDDEWEFASTQYDTEIDVSQKEHLRIGMSCTTQSWLISRYLNDQLNSERVRIPEIATGLSHIAANTAASSKTWNFVKANWDKIYNSFLLGSIISNLAANLQTETELDEFQRFFDEHPNQGFSERNIKLSVDRVKGNLRWIKSSYNQLETWLATYQNIDTPKIDYRLPTHLKPYQYDVLTKVQFVNLSITNNSFPYDGEVTMYFKCVSDTSRLVFHIDQLIVDNSTLSIKSLTDPTYQEIKAFDWANDYERQFFVANLTKPFKAGHNYTLYIKYSGLLTDDNVGFYRSSYIDNNGVRKWLMTSKLEPTWARKSYPCFDEPAMKASFRISAIHQKDYNALSNMPVQLVSSIDNNWARTDFYPTPAMSTYLFALVVSDFTCIYGNASAGLSGTLPIGSCGRPNVVNQLGFGLEIGIKIMEYLENLYNVKYTLPKCDHIAIPDFASGAMENWGLVTYRQAQYLLNPGVTSQSTEQAIATTIVHEIAHMWFGDIVSPLWWDDIWLNEGLARYFEYRSTAAIKKEYQLVEQFKNLFLNMLATDSSATSRAISIDVSRPEQIRALFDTITYSKGGSIIEMVNNFLGNQTFYKGVKRYLEKYSYGNTNGEMFWNEFDSAAKEDSKLQNLNLTEIMTPWMKQMGYPVVTIKRIDSKTISLTQNHFLLDPSAKPSVSSVYNYRWYVPFTHTIEKIGNVNSETMGLNEDNLWTKVTWFLPSETTKIIQLQRDLLDDEFILANVRASGFYRINYDNYYWTRIAKQLLANKNAIPIENRAQFIQDTISLAEARVIDGEKPFEILEYLKNETDELPWLGFFNRIGYFYNMLVITSVYNYYQTFMSDAITQLYIKLDWNDKPTDSWLDRQLRSNTVSFSCLRGVPECVAKAKLFYNNWMSNETNNPIPSAYRSFIYCTAIREGNNKEWDFALYRYWKENDGTERNNLLTGMSCSRDITLVNRFLNILLDKARTGDVISGLRSAAIRPDAILSTWNFVKENWDELFSRYSTNLAGLIVDFSTTFNTQTLLNDFTSFFDNNPDQSVLASQINTARERIKRNVAWYNKSFKSIKNWFYSKYEPSYSDVSQKEEVIIIKSKIYDDHSSIYEPSEDAYLP